jgi:hypothetical protein
MLRLLEPVLLSALRGLRNQHAASRPMADCN